MNQQDKVAAATSAAPPSPTVVHNHVGGKHKNKQQNRFLPDHAQSKTIERWKGNKTEVEISTVDGRSRRGIIADAGPYSIRLLTDYEDVAKGASEDVLLFKTGIVSISAPRETSAKVPEVQEKAEEPVAA